MLCPVCQNDRFHGDRCDGCGHRLGSSPERARGAAAPAVPVAPFASPVAGSVPGQSTAIHGAPAASVVVGGVLVEWGGNGEIFRIHQGKNVIGRNAASCQIVLDSPNVSSTHAIVALTDDRISLIDTSTNGTLVDGVKVHLDKVELPAEAVIQIDDRVFAFVAISRNLLAKLA